MDVLHTIDVGRDVGALVSCVFLALVVVGAAILSWKAMPDLHADVLKIIFPALAITFGIASYLTYVDYTQPAPKRYEVTVRDGTVIDAQKYAIIEQRGKIFVIEERKQ